MLYVIHGVVVCFVLFCFVVCFYFVEGGRDLLSCGGVVERMGVVCVRCDCDACCRQFLAGDWRRAYWACAEVANWVADAVSELYVIECVDVIFVVFFVVFVLLREGVIC